MYNVKKFVEANFNILLLAFILLLLAFAEYLPEWLLYINAHSISTSLHDMAALIWMSFPFYLAICAPITLLPVMGIRIYLAILLPVTLSIALLHIFLLTYWQIPLGRGILYVMFDTNKTEVAEYLCERLQPSLIIIFLGSIAAIAAITAFCLRLNWQKNKRSLLLFILLLIPLLISVTRYIVIDKIEALTYRVSTLRLVTDLISISSEHDQFYKAAVAAPELPNSIQLVAPELSNLLGIIVIGESATRRNHALYGYSRDTTPFQSARSDLLVFNQVFSAAPITVVSLKYAMTFATLYNPEEYRCTFVSILKKAGIRVIWLSAQGERCTTESLLFHDADRVLYSPANSFDNSIVKMLPEAMAGLGNSPAVIILHINGSHIDYSRRYPKEQARFNDTPPQSAQLSAKEIESVNHYDNSIAFTDSILKDVIAFLETQKRPAFLVYFSDHGEVPEKNGRNCIRNPQSCDPIFYEIPFWAWVSPQYHKVRPDFFENAKVNLDKPMQLDRGSIFALCDIAGIRFQNFPEEANIFSPSFRAQSIFFPGVDSPADSAAQKEEERSDDCLGD